MMRLNSLVKNGEFVQTICCHLVPSKAPEPPNRAAVLCKSLERLLIFSYFASKRTELCCIFNAVLCN